MVAKWFIILFGIMPFMSLVLCEIGGFGNLIKNFGNSFNRRDSRCEYTIIIINVIHELYNAHKLRAFKCMFIKF